MTNGTQPHFRHTEIIGVLKQIATASESTNKLLENMNNHLEDIYTETRDQPDIETILENIEKAIMYFDPIRSAVFNIGFRVREIEAHFRKPQKPADDLSVWITLTLRELLTQTPSTDYDRGYNRGYYRALLVVQDMMPDHIGDANKKVRHFVYKLVEINLDQSARIAGLGTAMKARQIREGEQPVWAYDPSLRLHRPIAKKDTYENPE